MPIRVASPARDRHSLVGTHKQPVLQQYTLGVGEGRKGSKNAWLDEFFFAKKKKKKKPKGGKLRTQDLSPE